MSFLFRIDRTETGHVLGRAAKLGPISAPERKLNRATFSILRLLTHISMYIGANTNSGVNIIKKYPKTTQGCCGHDRMVVGFIANYAISAYHHLRCEFESHPGEVYFI
jgi:hypothetical protein